MTQASAWRNGVAILLLLRLHQASAFLPTTMSAVDPVIAMKQQHVGRVFGPGPPGSWDDYKVSGPVVRLHPHIKDRWLLWYYGRSVAFNKTEGLSLADSPDGVTFTRVPGKEVGGAVLAPDDASPWSFDRLHVGIGDILYDEDRDCWNMYYFGGNDEWGMTPYGKARGIVMRIGQAQSYDGGMTWRRLPGPVLDKGAPGDFDQLFVAWPQVVDLTGIKNWVDEGVRLGMYYHTFNPQTFGFEIGLATSTNGRQWTKRGPVKLVRGEKGTFRDLGHATRCVIPDPTGQRKLLMFAEAANTQLASCIAVYGSDDGLAWDDLHDGPVLKGSGLGTGRWDAQALGCPSVLVHQGAFKMYYVGFTESRSEGAALGSIGLAVSEGLDYTKWKRAGEAVLAEIGPSAGDKQSNERSDT